MKKGIVSIQNEGIYSVFGPLFLLAALLDVGR
jgi:hypothetical protein